MPSILSAFLQTIFQIGLGSRQGRACISCPRSHSQGQKRGVPRPQGCAFRCHPASMLSRFCVRPGLGLWGSGPPEIPYLPGIGA